MSSFQNQHREVCSFFIYLCVTFISLGNTCKTYRTVNRIPFRLFFILPHFSHWRFSFLLQLDKTHGFDIWFLFPIILVSNIRNRCCFDLKSEKSSYFDKYTFKRQWFRSCILRILLKITNKNGNRNFISSKNLFKSSMVFN